VFGNLTLIPIDVYESYVFSFLLSFKFDWEDIPHTQDRVKPQIQTPQSSPKIPCYALCFQLSSWCLELGSNMYGRLSLMMINYLTSLLVNNRFLISTCYSIYSYIWGYTTLIINTAGKYNHILVDQLENT